MVLYGSKRRKKTESLQQDLSPKLVIIRRMVRKKVVGKGRSRDGNIFFTRGVGIRVWEKPMRIIRK